ncbi:MAG: hypothetical protein EBS68_08875 [Rhodobacteraceae bacterium]|jgi:hypothetical protein|nr:hypothetical protein [Paracoccaceae bacterium]
MSATADWSKFLTVGERLLWEGRPEPGFVLKPSTVLRLLLASFFLFNAVLWWKVSFAVAFALLAGGVWLGEKELANLFLGGRRRYALTTERALVMRKRPLGGVELQGWPITEETIVTLDDRQPGHVSFGFEPVAMKRNRQVRAVGFDRIRNPREVYELIRQLQRGEA